MSKASLFSFILYGLTPIFFISRIYFCHSYPVPRPQRVRYLRAGGAMTISMPYDSGRL